MKNDDEMRFGVKYVFECKTCCNSKDDKPCRLIAEAEFIPAFCPWEEGKRCNWKLDVDDGLN